MTENPSDGDVIEIIQVPVGITSFVAAELFDEV